MERHSGLSTSEVILNRKLYGSNNIDCDNKNSFWKLLIESFGDPIIKILLIYKKCESLRFVFFLCCDSYMIHQY